MSTTTATAAPVEPGLYPGLSFAEYHAIPAVNHSTLEPFNRSAAHAREEMLHPPEGTAAMALGHAFHVCLLEPERFALEYVVPPKLDRRTKAGKRTWADWESTHPGSLLISAEEAEAYERMRISVLEHPTASELLGHCVARELTIVWKDETTDMPCKARLDCVTHMGGWSFIVDVKTTKDARERSFQKDIAYYGYGRQAGWYRRGLKTIRPAERRYAFIAVEKMPPYAVACWELDELAIDQGERESVAHLTQYARCQETGVYPAYDAGLGLIALPAWATDRLDLGE